MKNFSNKFGYLVIMCIVLLVATPLFAKEWSVEQKDVLNSFEKYIAANLEGNVEEVMSYFHPKFSGWDYAQTHPLNKDAVHEIIEDIFKNNKMLKFECDPLEIQVEGNFAILHLNYEEILRDSTGKEISHSGRWSATMLKQDDKWVFISWSWIEKQ